MFETSQRVFTVEKAGWGGGGGEEGEEGRGGRVEA